MYEWASQGYVKKLLRRHDILGRVILTYCMCMHIPRLKPVADKNIMWYDVAEWWKQVVMGPGGLNRVRALVWSVLKVTPAQYVALTMHGKHGGGRCFIDQHQRFKSWCEWFSKTNFKHFHRVSRFTLLRHILCMSITFYKFCILMPDWAFLLRRPILPIQGREDIQSDRLNITYM